MGNIPKPRKPGQTGGGGRIGQTSNRNSSSNRGGRPHAGGGGSKGNGCAVLAIAMIGGLLAVLVGIGWGVKEAVAAPAAAPSVSFSKIQYDSAGSDTGSNTSLNGEYVRLTNNTSSSIDLKGWTVRDAAGHVYTFKSSYKLGAGKRAYVHTGKGTDGSPDSQHRYWGSAGYIWNNSGDTATLKKANGSTVDSCKWTSLGSGYTYC